MVADCSQPAPVLTLEDVSVTFSTGWGSGKHHLTAMDSVSFVIQPGETLGLVGESGSGKSTTGAVALGLQTPTSGYAQFRGKPLTTRLRDRAGQVGAVLQHPQWSLNPRRRIIDSVIEPLTVVNSPRRSRYETGIEILEQVGLAASFADRYPHTLSGGQRQRVAVARALITSPAFVLFDEAVSALDVSVQAQILNLITDLQAQRGFSALFISHDLGAVRYISHRVGVMQDGKLVEVAETETFYTRPSHPYSQLLLQELRS